ncbi:hypothetical protein AGLY_018247 [Aphis glycines]|uniref:Transmembrane protein n=1 Tax=Aphis glycines TaxID=307491 RepID=A0A6G0STD0_APHGL|nr:hypothetical protein AGLY_018247 [Aphis glycines]
MQNTVYISINNAIVPVDYAGNINYDEKNTKGTLLPIKQQYPFRPDFFFLFKDEYAYSNDDCISNFVLGKLWMVKIQQYECKLMFPYFKYNIYGRFQNQQSIGIAFDVSINICYILQFSLFDIVKLKKKRKKVGKWVPLCCTLGGGLFEAKLMENLVLNFLTLDINTNNFMNFELQNNLQIFMILTNFCQNLNFKC